MYENICLDYKVAEVKINVNMLQTISLPKDLKQLNKNLPKSNYQSDSQKEYKIPSVDSDKKES